MRKAIIGSAALHVAVIGVSLVTWPSLLRPSDDPTPMIPVDLVTIGETTNIAPTVREEPPPEETPPPQETAPPEPEPRPEPKAAEAAPPPEPEVAPEPEPEPEPAPEAEELAVDVPAPKPSPPKPKPPPEKPAEKFDVDNILALLDKQTPRTTAPPAAAQRAERTNRGIGAQDAFTMDLRNALLAQMRECWNVPAGAPNPEQLIVEVHISLSRDGRLARPPALSTASRAAAARDPFMRAAAEAALRAVNVCEPYRVPPERYDDWREIDMIFDPSKMVGR